MSEYSYDKQRVAESINSLEGLSKQISSLQADMISGLSTIKNARGAANYIDLKESSIDSFIEECDNELNELISNLNYQVQAIEKYQKDQEDINSASFIKKACSTVGMVALNLIEGVGSTVESVVDGFASLVGIFSSRAREFVKKDHVGDWFASKYESGLLSSVNKYSYMSYDGTAASVFKGIGSAIPAIVLAFATAGSSLAVQAIPVALAGVSGLGSKVESELQLENTSYTTIMAKGIFSGAIEGFLTYAIGHTNVDAVTRKLGETGTKISNLKLVRNVSEKLHTVSNKILKKPISFITVGHAKSVLGALGKTRPAKLLKSIAGTVKDKITSPFFLGLVDTGIFAALGLTAKKVTSEVYSGSTATDGSTLTDADSSQTYNIDSPEAKSTNSYSQQSVSNKKVDTQKETGSSQSYNNDGSSKDDGTQYRKTSAPTPTPSQTQSVTKTATQTSTLTKTATQTSTQVVTQTEMPTPTLAWTESATTVVNNNNYYSTQVVEQVTGENGEDTPNIIEVLDDGLSDETTATDTTNDIYDEPYTVETPIDTTTTSKSKSMAGPILAGLGLAGAAGVGTKVYLDKKKQQEAGEYDETSDEYESDDTSPIKADGWEEDTDNSEYEDNNGFDYEYPID